MVLLSTSCRVAFVVDTAAITSGRVAADSAVGDHQRSVSIGGALTMAPPSPAAELPLKSAVAYVT